jgi:hypothetical protein
MAKRAIHYEPNRDESDRTFCGTDGEFEQQHLTSYKDHVTCKRCRKILAREHSYRAKEIERSKAFAWDSFAERVKQIGYTDPWDALADLCKRKGLPLFADF